MKQYLSVLMVASRSSIYKIAGGLLLMGGIEFASFYYILHTMQAGNVYTLEQMITKSRIPLICGLFFLLLCVVLCMTGLEIAGSRVRYTLQRLPVREEIITLLWATYNIACFFLFWMVQLLLVLIFSRLYTSQIDPSYINEQTIFLAFYRNNFMHSLLPLEEISRLIRNILLVIGLGVSASCFSFQLRHERKGIAGIAILATITVLTFTMQLGNLGSDLFLSAIALLVIVFSVIGLWRRNENEASA